MARGPNEPLRYGRGVHHAWLRAVSRPGLAAAAVYCVAIAACFPTIVAHPGTAITPGGDGMGTIRDYWAAAAQHRNPFDFTLDRLSGAPQGAPRTPATVLANGGVQTAFVWELKGALGLVGAWNAFMLLGLLATGLAMFALLRRLGCSIGASLLGGYVFAFSPYALERAYIGHLGLLQNWIYPLLAGLLLRLHARGLPAAAAVGAGLAVAFYLSAYQGLLAGLMTAVFFAVELWRGRAAVRRLLRTALTAGVAYACCLVTVSPILVLYAREHAAVLQGTAHSNGDLYHYAASLTAYLLPSPRNPLFHWLRGVHPTDLTEQTLFFGYSTAALALIAVALLLRRDAWLTATETRRFAVVFLAFLAPAAFLFSLPPTYTIGSVRVPMPSDTIGLLSGIWRVFSRFGLLAGFALAVLAALGLTALSHRHPARARLITLAVICIAVLEVLPGNVGTVSTLARAQPAWVTWLAARPATRIATYPWIFGVTLSQDDWYQTFDRDPQFFLPPRSPYVEQISRDAAIRLLARDVQDPIAARVLASEGVRLVVVHDNAYRQVGQVPPALPAGAFTLLRRFGTVRIFALHATPLDLGAALDGNAATLGSLQGFVPATLAYGGGFEAPEQFNGATSRWMTQDGQLQIDASAASTISLSGFAFSNARPRVLELLDARREVSRAPVDLAQCGGVPLGPISVPAGTSTLTLVATPGPAPLGGNDSRVPSVFLEPVTVSSAPDYSAATNTP